MDMAGKALLQCMDAAGLCFCAQLLCNQVDMSQPHAEAASPIKVNATCSVAVVLQGEQEESLSSYGDALRAQGEGSVRTCRA